MVKLQKILDWAQTHELQAIAIQVIFWLLLFFCLGGCLWRPAPEDYMEGYNCNVISSKDKEVFSKATNACDMRISTSGKERCLREKVMLYCVPDQIKWELAQ